MEITHAIAEAIRKRTASTALGSYLFFWAAFHWQGVYASLFTSQELIYKQHGLLKNEYVNKYFFGFHGIDDWSFYLGIIVPLVLTIIFIWPFSKYALIHAYRLEQEHKTERRKIKYVEDKKIRDLDIKIVNKEAEVVQAETRLSKSRQDAQKVDPTLIWDKEYDDFRHSRYFGDMRHLIDSYYNHSGRIRDDYDKYNDEWGFEVPNLILVYADTNGLIELNDTKEKIDFTEKGKYFVKKSSEDEF